MSRLYANDRIMPPTRISAWLRCAAVQANATISASVPSDTIVRLTALCRTLTTVANCVRPSSVERQTRDGQGAYIVRRLSTETLSALIALVQLARNQNGARGMMSDIDKCAAYTSPPHSGMPASSQEQKVSVFSLSDRHNNVSRVTNLDYRSRRSAPHLAFKTQSAFLFCSQCVSATTYVFIHFTNCPGKSRNATGNREDQE